MDSGASMLVNAGTSGAKQDQRVSMRAGVVVSSREMASLVSEPSVLWMWRRLMPAETACWWICSVNLPVLTVMVSKKLFGFDGEAEGGEAGGEFGGEAVDPGGDGFEAFGAVVDGVHSGHDGEQDLRGADVGGGLLAADVLLAGLEGEAVGLGSSGVDRDAD